MAKPPAESISLCLIVRNEADIITRCLNSAVDWVREIVVVDTGSTDGTQDIVRAWARERGRVVKLSAYHWWDNFAAARNNALRKCSQDWVLTLDADDIVFNPDELPRMLALAETHGVAGWYSTYRQDASCRQQRLQLFRRTLWEWEGVVHETLRPVRVKALPVALSNLVVLHKKPISRVKQAAQQYLDILKKSDPGNHFGLAESYKVLGDLDTAQYHYHQAFHFPGANPETRYISMYHVSRINFGLAPKEPERLELAQLAAVAGLAVLDGSECWTMLARCMMVLGDDAKAQQALERALACQMDPEANTGLVFPAYYHDIPLSLLATLDKTAGHSLKAPATG